MTRETVLTNVKAVLPDEVIEGSVLLCDGLIADVGPRGAERGEDFEGDYLLPGLVELHTDHLESHFMPRPGAKWDPIPAVLAHDGQFGASGATTVFDAVRVGAMSGPNDASTFANEMAEAIAHAEDAGLLRAQHFIHLRCEVSAPGAVEEFDRLADVSLIRLASLMDHTPGARQFADISAFRTYMVGKGRVAESEFDALVEELKAVAAEHSEPNRAAIAERATSRGVTLATHDDATVEHVEQSIALGARISEFPTTVVAAEAARERGQLIVMGAPNIVRGGSQSGNVAAAELLARGLLDVLSSDYVPFSSLQAVFRLWGEGALTIPEGAALVADNPARAVGLDDRGRIAPGRRADLVRVHAYRGATDAQHPGGHPIPVVRGVWREGRRVG